MGTFIRCGKLEGLRAKGNARNAVITDPNGNQAACHPALIFLEPKLVLLDKTQMKSTRPTFAGLLPPGRFLAGRAPTLARN
jgi:hypothetical protein